MNFKEMSVEERSENGRKGGVARRSPELQFVWDNADKIKKENLGASELARKYKVSKRSMYRILNGK